MANITFRESATPTIPSSTSVKNTPLTNLEVDSNFKSLNDDVQTRATSTEVTNSINNSKQTSDTNALAFAIALG